MTTARVRSVCSAPDAPPGARVVEAMVRRVKVLGRDATVRDVVEFFADDHVHLALVVDGRRVLTSIERADLADDPEPDLRARDIGTLTGRWVGPHDDLAGAHRYLLRTGKRRLVVLDGAGRLLGLLCLKRHGRGFCRDDDVRARAADRRE